MELKMSYSILICLVFVPGNFAQFFDLVRQPFRQPIRRPANFGSTAVAAGNPAVPAFMLTPAQNSQLPNIDPDTLDDTVLSTVINLK